MTRDLKVEKQIFTVWFDLSSTKLLWLKMDATTAEMHISDESSSGYTENIASAAAEIAFYYKLLICLLGCFGNITNIIVIKYTQMHTTTRIIITILAVSDLLYLLFDFPALVFPKFEKISFYDYTAETCRLGISVGIFLGFISYYMVALLTIDRCLAVVLPLHSKILFSPKRLAVVIVVLACAQLIWVSFLTEDYDLHTTSNENGTILGVSCDTMKYFEALQYVSSIVDTAIPVLIVVTGNIVISVSVCRHMRTRSAITGRNASQSTESRLLMTTISVSACFTLSAVPMQLYWAVGHSVLPEEIFNNQANPYYLILDCIHYTNFAINFLLYVAFTKSFREQFLVIVWSKAKARCRFGKSGAERSFAASTSSVDVTNLETCP